MGLLVRTVCASDVLRSQGWRPLIGAAATGIAIGFWAYSFAAHAGERTDGVLRLSGRMRTAAGEPVAGAAVAIQSARPRQGQSRILGFNYDDCLKYAFTDAAGCFSIEGVSGDLLFRLLVKHPDFGHQFVADVDPRGNEPTVTLRPAKLKAIANPANLVWGRVVTPKGDYIAGAIVTPRGYMQGNTGLEGPMEELAQVTVTDQQGRFSIPSTTRVTALHLTVHARGFVPEFFSDVAAGAFEQIVRLRDGFSVHGRVVHDGRPQVGITVGACWSSRHSGSWWGPWQTITGDDGRFTLHHLTPDEELCVYVAMKSVPTSAPPSILLTGADGDEFDLGDLEITAGHRLAGRVTLSTDDPLPVNMRVVVWRDAAYDRTMAPVAADGTFEIDHLPRELLNVSALAFKRGTDDSVFPWPYHLSAENKGLDPLNPQRLVGRLDDDTEITIMLAPGAFKFPERTNTQEESERINRKLGQLRKSPLRGIVEESVEQPVEPSADQ